VAAPELRPPSPEEVAKILRIVGNDPEFAVFLQLSSVSGARRSELLALRWSDIGFELGTMTICRAIVAGPAGVVVKDTKTHSARRVALDSRTVDVLRRYRRYLDDRAADCGATLADDCLVFASDVAMSTTLQVRV
jgi:integrase